MFFHGQKCKIIWYNKELVKNHADYNESQVHKCHRSWHVWWNCVFVREVIPSKLISKETLNIEGIIFELTFHKKKGLLSCSYNLDISTFTDHVEILRRNLDLYSTQYENIIIICDFNTSMNHSCMKSFSETDT